MASLLTPKISVAFIPKTKIAHFFQTALDFMFGEVVEKELGFTDIYPFYIVDLDDVISVP